MDVFNRFSVRTAEVHQIAVQGIDSIGGKWGAVAGAGCRLGCETPHLKRNIPRPGCRGGMLPARA